MQVLVLSYLSLNKVINLKLSITALASIIHEPLTIFNQTNLSPLERALELNAFKTESIHPKAFGLVHPLISITILSNCNDVSNLQHFYNFITMYFNSLFKNGISSTAEKWALKVANYLNLDQLKILIGLNNKSYISIFRFLIQLDNTTIFTQLFNLYSGQFRGIEDCDTIAMNVSGTAVESHSIKGIETLIKMKLFHPAMSTRYINDDITILVNKRGNKGDDLSLSFIADVIVNNKHHLLKQTSKQNLINIIFCLLLFGHWDQARLELTKFNVLNKSMVNNAINSDEGYHILFLCYNVIYNLLQIIGKYCINFIQQ